MPGPDDAVCVAMRDTVVFDGHDADRASCSALYLDPEAVLTIGQADGAHTLTVAGPIESYGVIRLDGTPSPNGTAELRVIDDGQGPPRTVRLLQNSSLLTYGHKGLAEGRKNAQITLAAAEAQVARSLTIAADSDVMIDLQETTLTNVALVLRSLDNTGVQASERLNLIGNRFTGASRLELHGCDTPTIRSNVFEGTQAIPQPAMQLTACKLAEMHGNRITGKYTLGVMVHTDVDSSFIGNTIEDSATGVHWRLGKNAMIRHNTIANCQRGVILHQTTGSMEHTTVRSATTAFLVTSSDLQFTTCSVEELPEDAQAMSATDATVTLINCNLTDDRITLGGKSTVQAMAYLVVEVAGNRPDGTEVMVRTAKVSGGVPKGKADLNVRNAPAHLGADGITALPATMRPLVVRSWKLTGKNQRQNAPFYDLMVIAPSDKDGDAPRTLITQLIEPADDWYRPDPNDRKPTLGVKIP